jgi:hypothetical protein
MQCFERDEDQEILCRVARATPFFSVIMRVSQYRGLMLIAHVKHGEVYVPSIEKTFF